MATYDEAVDALRKWIEIEEDLAARIDAIKSPTLQATFGASRKAAARRASAARRALLRLEKLTR